MSLMPPSDESIAHRWSRTVGVPEAMPALIISPGSGNRQITLGSVQAVAQFLVPMPFKDVQAAGMRVSVHYIDFAALAIWIRETIEDCGLAEELEHVISDGRAFGMLVGDVKDLLMERVVQCGELLEPQDGEL